MFKLIRRVISLILAIVVIIPTYALIARVHRLVGSQLLDEDILV